MTVRSEHEAVIEEPPSRIFALIDDLERTPTWQFGCAKLEKVGSGPNAEGDRLELLTRAEPGGHARPAKLEGRIIKRVPGERFAYAIENKPYSMIWDARIREIPRGSKVTLAVEMRPNSKLAGLVTWLFGRLLLAPLHRMAERDLKAIEERLREDRA